MICARSGPTETKVPVESLKSSAMPAVEDEAALRVRGIDRLGGVAAAEEAFVVEALGGLRRRAPVAGRDVRAAVAHLQLGAGPVAFGHELQLAAGRRQADVARLHLLGVGADREGRGLGHAEAGRACGCVRRIPARPRRSSLSQTGCDEARAGEEEHLHAAEEVVWRSGGVGLQRVGDLLEALGHVEVDRRRDLAQVAQGLADQRRRRLAFVDVERAAVVERRCRRCGCRRRCGSTAASRPAPAARRRRPGKHCRIICWLEQSMRCVLIDAPSAAWSSRR